MKKVILACLGLMTLLAAWLAYRLKSPALSIQKDTIIVLDANDSTNDSVIKKLTAHDLKAPWLFGLIAQKMNMQNGLKKGQYEVKTNMTFFDLCRLFRAGKFQSVDFTIKPLIQLNQFQKLYGLKFDGDSIDMSNCLKDSNYLKSIGFNDTTLFALLIPNTYNILYHSSPQEVLAYLKRQYTSFWDSSKLQKASALGLTPIQIASLASIVSKESNQVNEMPMIAGMYLNRLKIGMPLQADPTVKFALNQPGLKRILIGHLTIESPYNTYLHKGLPPGPICVPSSEAIEAVLNPEAHKYLYMCAKADFSGAHAFSTNYKQHLKLAKAYQKALDAKNIH